MLNHREDFCPYLYLIRVCHLTSFCDPLATLIVKNVVISTFVGCPHTSKYEPFRCHHLHTYKKFATRTKKYPRHMSQGICYPLPQTKKRGYGGLLPSAVYTSHNIDGCCRYDPRSEISKHSFSLVHHTLIFRFLLEVGPCLCTLKEPTPPGKTTLLGHFLRV